MLNILILSAGTRNKIVEYFKKELNGEGKVIVTDCNRLAPALYVADKYYIVPKIDAPEYLEVILDICVKENIKGLFSLIDPELSLIAKHKHQFIELGVMPFVSDYEQTELCFNKYEFYQKCQFLNIPTVRSYINFDEFKQDYKNDNINFPVFVKPHNGSCSINVQKINNLEDLEFNMDKYDNLMIQEYMNGIEYGVDVYVDVLSHEIISVFIKQKLLMRAGETDKSVSLKNDTLLELIKRFVSKMKFEGQIDIDVFEMNGEFYISEVNPRFGGGYLHAYECGCNFPKYMIENMKGNINDEHLGEYQTNIYMMKYLEVLIKEEKDAK